jgi:hypothetical protein
MCCDLSLQNKRKEKKHAQIMVKKREKRKGEKDSPCPKEREKGERWNHIKGVQTTFQYIPPTHLHVLIGLYDLYSTWIWSLALQHI